MDNTFQIDDDELQSILNELKLEEIKYENSCIVQKELENISVICFTKNIESIIDKLFNVSVKICDTFKDLRALEICDDNYNKIFDGQTSCYVLQIFVSDVFQSKLITGSCIANISIKNSMNVVYKTVHLKNIIPSNILSIIVPFTKSIEPFLINVNLFLPSENYWWNIKVSTIKTDISYHFIPLYEHKILNLRKISPLFQISKLYTNDVEFKFKRPVLNYRFSCAMNVRQLFETILRNCIHKLDIDHLQTLTNSDTVVDLHLSINNCESAINLDTKNNILRISGDYTNLYALKEFFTANIKEEKKEISVHSSFLQQLQTLRMKLHEERSKKDINFDNLKMFFEEYKNLIAELPM